VRIAGWIGFEEKRVECSGGFVGYIVVYLYLLG
jgi:hypothetical protein